MTHRRRLLVGATVGTVALLSSIVHGLPAYALGILPPSNPPANIAPNPSYTSACPTTPSAANSSATCTAALVQDINYARSLEGVGPITLPSNYTSLTPAEQLLEATGDERVDRGLSAPQGLVDLYDQESLTGADNSTDPIGPSNAAWGSNYAGGYASTLEAMYAGMYNDGPGSANGSCTSTNTSGCWGHRDNILGEPTVYGTGPLYMGAAQGTPNGGASYAEILVAPASTQTVVYPYTHGSGTTGTCTPTLAITSGSNQTTTINTSFGTGLVVTESCGGVLTSGTSITYTAPTSGATATFNGSSTYTTSTGANGQGASVTPLANGVSGTYQVVASDTNGDTVSFTLTNAGTTCTPALALTSGSSQSTTVSTSFGAGLVVTESCGGVATSGASITYTAPTSGATATLNGASTYTTSTGSNGQGVSVVPVANGTSGTYQVVASDTHGDTVSFTLTNTAATPVGVSGSQYVTLPNPVRVTDTRPSSGYPNSGSPITFGAYINVPLAANAPSNATAVVLNVTAVNANTSGFLTVYPTGAPLPLVSNLNFVAGAPGCGTLDCVVPNLVTVPLGQGSQVSVYAGYTAGGTVDAVVDMEGYYVPTTNTGAGHYYPLSPQRLVDTRCGGVTPPNFCAGDNLPAVNSGLTTVPAHGTLQFNTSPLPVSTGAVEAVVLNIATTNTGSQGYLTAYPAGAAQPTASNANWVQNQTSASRVIVATGTGSAPGQVDLYNGSNSSVDVIVDASGYYSNASGSSTGGTLFEPIAPQRITDTRAGSGEPNAGYTITQQGNLSVQVSGVAGVPAGALAAAVNLTAVAGSYNSFLSALPVAPPSGSYVTTSDVNFQAYEVRANAGLVTLGSGGAFDLFNNAGSTNAIVDISGYFVAA